MADINQQTAAPTVQPPIPIQWSWIAQRQETGGKGSSIWKLGFMAPDGAEVRVTFHQVGDVAGQQAATQEKDQAAAQQSMQMGMPPQSDPADFAPAGQPDSDQTQDATFYVTFLSSRHPEQFMRWDTSLSHEDSLTVWVTITHGIVDFVRKAKPANVILDDLSNGKLKMVLRSVAMDIVASNPEYEIEQTQKHHYRTFFQVKKTGMQSAFGQDVAGTPAEGDNAAPGQPSPVTTGGAAQVQAQAQQQVNDPNPLKNMPPSPEEGNETGGVDDVNDDKTQDPTAKQPSGEPGEQTAQFASNDEIPIKQTTMPKRGLTIEIGKDYSIAVKDKDGNAVDRYRGKGPIDVLRWITDKGYGGNKMKIVDAEQPSGDRELAPERSENHPEDKTQSSAIREQFSVKGNAITVLTKIEPKQAAMINLIVNASSVRLVDEGVEFSFETDRDMNFKKALVELAVQKTHSAKGVLVHKPELKTMANAWLRNPQDKTPK